MKKEGWDVGFGVLLSFLSLCRPGEGHWQLGMSQNQPCTVCWWKLSGETMLNPISCHMKPKAEASRHKSYVQIKRQWREGTWGSKSRGTVRNGWISWVSEPGSRAPAVRAGLELPSDQNCPALALSRVQCMTKPARTCTGLDFLFFNVHFMALTVRKKAAGNSG